MTIHRSPAASVRAPRAAAATPSLPPARSAGRRLAALLALAAPFLLATPGVARETRPDAAPVKLAEVASKVDAASTRLANVTDLLRHDVEAEIAAIDWTQAKLRRRYTLSAAVVRLESATTGERTLSASCTVSAAVRDDRGTLLAIVEGRARADDAANAAARAERDALAAAARSAIKRVPETIRLAQ